MKKYILQGLFLFLLGCSANISLYTKPQSSRQENFIQSSAPVAQMSYAEKSSDAIISQLPSTATIVSSENSSALDEVDQIIASVGPRKDDANFLVNTSRDTILQCPEGSILKVNANSFVDAAGNTVEGEVKVKVKECYKLKDIIANKLGTTCNGKLIETAGMVNIAVTNDGNELMLAEGKEMGIAMPAGRGTGYELFYGETDADGLLNWVLDEENPVVTKSVRAQEMVTKEKMGKPVTSDLKNLFEIDTTCQFGITKMILEESAGNYEMKEFNFKDVMGNKLSDFLMTRFTPDKKTKSRVCASNEPFSVNLKVDANGKLLNPQIDETVSKPSRLSLRKILKEAPILNRNFFDPYSDNHERLNIVFGNTLLKNQGVQELVWSDELNATWTGITQNWVKEGNAPPSLSYYVGSALKVGWINCDRFSRADALVTITVESKDPAVDEVMVVFDDDRSAMCAVRKNGVFKFILPTAKNMRVISLVNDPGKQRMAGYRIKSGTNRRYIIDDVDTKNGPDTGKEITAPV